MTATASAPEAARESPWARRATTIGRRLITIPGMVALCLLSLVSAPLWIAGSLVADAVRRRDLATLRTFAFVAWFVHCEIAGLLGCLGLWLVRPFVSRERYDELNYELQIWWARMVFGGGARIFDLTLEIEGEDAVAAGPMLLFPRHASVADTILWGVFVQSTHRLRLRYVFKRELLWDPCLDVGGHRLPNYFVRRDSGDAPREVAGVVRLLDDLGPREGVIIYPEGTRFTPEKRERVLRRLRASGDREVLAAAESMQHVLPPRMGGPLGLLERNPGLDVVFCAHEGFDGVRTLRDIIRGELVGRVVRLRFWRIPFADLPADRAALRGWLLGQWRRVDAFVGEALARRREQADAAA